MAFQLNTPKSTVLDHTVTYKYGFVPKSTVGYPIFDRTVIVLAL